MLWNLTSGLFYKCNVIYAKDLVRKGITTTDTEQASKQPLKHDHVAFITCQNDRS